jgi:threonine 3-dehydrogenase
MRKKVILITGAAGEIGHALVKRLYHEQDLPIVTFDLNPIPEDIRGLSTHIQGDILDSHIFSRLVSEYEFDKIFHLAALLSTRSEFTPDVAHRVNVGGTMALLKIAAEQSQWRNKPVQFIFPSSIAVYGLRSLSEKTAFGEVREWDWNYPTTMYGCNKLYCEQLGIYFSKYYRQLAEDSPTMLDFRSVRFPGLISAYTLPSGGTSDFGPEMLHAAAKGETYHCFVRPDTRIPFMAMPDAIDALLNLSAAPQENLTRPVYNVTSFSPSAEEFRQRVLQDFPDADIDFVPDLKRQGIVDTWPEALVDKTARRDWGWQPAFDLDRAFDEYLVPNIRKRYQK